MHLNDGDMIIPAGRRKKRRSGKQRDSLISFCFVQGQRCTLSTKTHTQLYIKSINKMARTKQTARRSTGGKAPRKRLFSRESAAAALDYILFLVALADRPKEEESTLQIASSLDGGISRVRRSALGQSQVLAFAAADEESECNIEIPASTAAIALACSWLEHGTDVTFSRNFGHYVARDYKQFAGVLCVADFLHLDPLIDALILSIGESDAPAWAPAPNVLPDTADESYKGTFVTDVYDPLSTVKQPEFLYFPKSIFKVLKQVHPDTGIDLGAMYVMEDYNRHLLRSLVEQAARFANEKRCQSFADYIQTPNKSLSEDRSKEFFVVGEDSGKYLIYHNNLKEPERQLGWEARDIVAKYLGPQLAAWKTKDPAEMKSLLDKYLAQEQDSVGEKGYFPGGITSRDIQTAVRLCLPGELVKHAMKEAKKAVTILSNGKENYSRSHGSGLVFDVDQIGAIMSQTTSMVVSETAAVYLTAVMEYMTAEVLELSGIAAGDNRSSWIIPRHIQLAFRNDEELNKFKEGCTIMSGGVLPCIQTPMLPLKRGAPIYNKDYEEEGLHWVGDNEDKDSETDKTQEMLNDYQNIVIAASEMLCYDKDDHKKHQPFPEGALTPETLDVVLAEKNRKEKERVAVAKQKRDNIEGITNHQIKRLAARGGCVMVSQLIYDEIRRVAKAFLENILRDTITYAEHDRSFTVSPEHVLSAAARQGRTLWGTGRLPLPLQSVHPYQQRGHDLENPESGKRGGFLHEFTMRQSMNAVESSEYSQLTYAKYSRCRFNGSIEEHEEELAQELVDAANSAKEEALEEEECAKEEEQREREEEEEQRACEEEDEGASFPPTYEQEKNHRLHLQSCALVRKMQSSVDRVIPYLPLAQICMEIGEDFMTDLCFSPVAINLIGELLETYLVGVFERSLEKTIDGKRLAVEPKDILFAQTGRLSYPIGYPENPNTPACVRAPGLWELKILRFCIKNVPPLSDMLVERLGIEKAVVESLLHKIVTSPASELTYEELELCDGGNLVAPKQCSRWLKRYAARERHRRKKKSRRLLEEKQTSRFRLVEDKQHQEMKERLAVLKKLEMRLWVAVDTGNLDEAKEAHHLGANPELFGDSSRTYRWHVRPFKECMSSGKFSRELYTGRVEPHLIRNGITTLMRAAQRGDVAMINWLLDVGCDVNAGLPDNLESGDGYGFGGMTAIVCATTVPAVKALLQRGANPNMSYTPPQYEANLNERSALVDHLVLRDDWRDREEIARCLVRYGADPNSVGFPCHGTGQDDGRYYSRENTPTAYWPRVVSSGDVDWAKQLLELYGADPNWPGRRENRNVEHYHLGANVLQYAILSQNKPMVELLIEHGADVNQPEDVWLSQDMFDGYETLFFLSEEQCLHYWGEESIQFTPVPSLKKATPLSVAIGVGNDGIVDLLKEKGAVAQDENAKLPVVFSYEL